MLEEAVRSEWGENLRRRRESLGMTQEELAAALQVRQPVVSRWENGHRAPRDDFKVRIARELRLDVRTLFPLIVSESA